MLRKSIFLSLIALVVLAITWTIVRPMRRGQAREVAVKQSKPTPTRLLQPTDLEIATSNLELTMPRGLGAQKPGAGKRVAGKHNLLIRNSGEVSYRNVMLAISYVDAAGKTLETRNLIVPDSMMPGKSTSVSGLAMESVPCRTVSCVVTILYADIERSK